MTLAHIMFLAASLMASEPSEASGPKREQWRDTVGEFQTRLRRAYGDDVARKFDHYLNAMGMRR